MVTTGALIHYTVKPIVIPIKLEETASVRIPIFRPVPDSLRISLKFENIDTKDRSALGRWSNDKGDWRETGYINFLEPGESILLQVIDDVNTTIYEAEPAGGVESSETVWRDFVPYVNDGRPNIFVWPPKNEQRTKLHTGKTNLNISVLQVGANLRGETASLIIDSPISFKSVAQNYELIWWIIFWPIYAFGLSFYGLILAIKTINYTKTSNAANAADAKSRAAD